MIFPIRGNSLDFILAKCMDWALNGKFHKFLECRIMPRGFSRWFLANLAGETETLCSVLLARMLEKHIHTITPSVTADPGGIAVMVAANVTLPSCHISWRREDKGTCGDSWQGVLAQQPMAALNTQVKALNIPNTNLSSEMLFVGQWRFFCSSWPGHVAHSLQMLQKIAWAMAHSRCLAGRKTHSHLFLACGLALSCKQGHVS